jgi:type IV pilus assembly protein PilM
MSSAFPDVVRRSFPAPRFLTFPTAGVDVSASGIKVAIISETPQGLTLADYGEERLPVGAFTSADISDRSAVVAGIRNLARAHGVHTANIALPESRAYLFEADLSGETRAEKIIALESHLDEYVPLPPAEVSYSFVPVGKNSDPQHIVAVGYARRVVAESLATFDEAHVRIRGVESETFSIPRALLAPDDTSTVLIIDIGKTTTKLIIAAERLPRYATTLDIGGHALTLAVQKHFGVTEEEAKRIKTDRGLLASEGNEEYMTALLSTVAAIRDEVAKHLEYWQTRAVPTGKHEKVSRAIVIGGNATLKGLPEYLSTGLGIPVDLGDVFTNFASRDVWMPPVDYMQSLAYATAIGLALREYVP